MSMNKTKITIFNEGKFGQNLELWVKLSLIVEDI
jgi:hypothetical protein